MLAGDLIEILKKLEPNAVVVYGYSDKDEPVIIQINDPGIAEFRIISSSECEGGG